VGRRGRLTVSAPGGTDTFVYNDRSGLLSASGPSGAASFGYDGDGNPTGRADASGTARYGYVKGRLATVTDGITGTTQSLGYDAAGQPKTVDHGSGRVRTFGYDEFGRMASDEVKNGAGQKVASIGRSWPVRAGQPQPARISSSPACRFPIPSAATPITFRQVERHFIAVKASTTPCVRRH
jgi:YD repeat-containing protein